MAQLYLDLSNCSLTQEGASSLGNSLGYNNRLSKLELNLEGNFLDIKEATNLVNELFKCLSLQILSIVLKKCLIGVQGSDLLGDSLKNLIQITSLNLNLGMNNIGIEGALKIVSNLSSCQNLISLNLILEQNQFTFQQKSNVFVINILKYKSQNNIGDDKIGDLGVFLNKIKIFNILEISIYCNQVGQKGVSAFLLGLSFKLPKSLKYYSQFK
ncbi:hypothetical protein ABPG72_001797 [Tetrahymena utriculariae]